MGSPRINTIKANKNSVFVASCLVDLLAGLEIIVCDVSQAEREVLEDELDLLGGVLENLFEVFGADDLDFGVAYFCNCCCVAGVACEHAEFAETSNRNDFRELDFVDCAVVLVDTDLTAVDDVHALADFAFLEDDRAVVVCDCVVGLLAGDCLCCFAEGLGTRAL